VSRIFHLLSSFNLADPRKLTSHLQHSAVLQSREILQKGVGLHFTSRPIEIPVPKGAAGAADGSSQWQVWDLAGGSPPLNNHPTRLESGYRLTKAAPEVEHS
jgi:hypothetical protein